MFSICHEIIHSSVSESVHNIQCFSYVSVAIGVPPQLKKLVRMVARAFYGSLHVVCLDLLSNYPW